MFTGLIQDVGRIVTIRRAARGARLTIRCALALGDVAIGDSIAVDGACLTMVARSSGDCFDADVSEETLARTKLGTARRGAPVNLELALRLGDRLGGHLVQGHVDGVGTLVAREPVGDAWDVTYELPEQLLDTVVEKGSITLDGVSLTVARLDGRRVTVAVVPHTASCTTVMDVPLGGQVNVETDLIGKYVRRVLSRTAAGGSSGLTLEGLANAGFL